MQVLTDMESNSILTKLDISFVVREIIVLDLENTVFWSSAPF